MYEDHTPWFSTALGASLIPRLSLRMILSSSCGGRAWERDYLGAEFILASGLLRIVKNSKVELDGCDDPLKME